MPLPASIDAERALLGTLVAQSLPWPSGLLPSHFAEPNHQDIAAAVIRLIEEGRQHDEQTVWDTLKAAGTTVTAHYLSDLTTESAFRTWSSSWPDLIRKAAALRSILIAAAKLRTAAEEPGADPDALIAYAEGTIGSIGRVRTKTGPQRMDLTDLEAFDRKADPDVVLGNRWLCKGGSLLIVGQSGTGKSSLMMQAAVSWAVGRPFFGIRAKRPLRIVILQAENDHGDVAEAFQDCVHGVNLHQNQRDLLDDNLAIYRDTTSVGTDFTAQLKELITRNRADMVFVDPLLSFAGIDVSDQEQASRFLRHDIAPILLETGAVLVAMHHTGKPKTAADKEGQTVADLAYAGLGSSEFTNYFREVAVLFRCQGEHPVYKFGLTKRRGRAGLQNADGDFAGDILIRHSRQQGVIRWEYAVQEDTQPDPQTPRQLSVKGPPRRSDG